MRKLLFTAMAAFIAAASAASAQTDSSTTGAFMIDTSTGDCMVADGNGELVLVDGTCEDYVNGGADTSGAFYQPDEVSTTS